MTRKYEIVYIFDSAMDEAAIDARLESHHALLKDDGHPSPIDNVTHWGKRTLAYPIANHPVGHYVIVQFQTDGALLPEFERALKLDDSVIRYLIVLNEGEIPVLVPAGEGGDESESNDRAGAKKEGD